MTATPPLSQGVGYGVVIGLGILFAVVSNFISLLFPLYCRLSPI